jgi:hypothetical protein
LSSFFGPLFFFDHVGRLVKGDHAIFYASQWYSCEERHLTEEEMAITHTNLLTRLRLEQGIFRYIRDYVKTNPLFLHNTFEIIIVAIIAGWQWWRAGF